jgi:hypothetical protein
MCTKPPHPVLYVDSTQSQMGIYPPWANTHWVSSTTNAYSIHRSWGVEDGKGSRVDEADAGAPPLILVDAEAATPPRLGLTNAGAGSRVMSLFTRAA